MQHRSRPLVLGALAIAVAVVVAACSSGARGAGSGPQAAGGDGQTTIAFATPTDGAQLTIPFDVQLEASVPLGEPESGNHHAHLYFDTSTDAADYDIVYGTSWQVQRPLAPGQHTIIVALANPDHSLAGPTQAITVTVGSGDAGGSGGAPTPVPTGLGY